MALYTILELYTSHTHTHTNHSTHTQMYIRTLFIRGEGKGRQSSHRMFTVIIFFIVIID